MNSLLFIPKQFIISKYYEKIQMRYETNTKNDKKLKKEKNLKNQIYIIDKFMN